MTRVWYCAKCGYEVHSRGRCHACREKLTPSDLPELPVGSEDEEVGYRIDGWSERDRAKLIVQLNSHGIEHRFEEEELVVGAGDESRVDDLVALLGEGAGVALDGPEDGDDADETALDDLDGSGDEVTDGGPDASGSDPAVPYEDSPAAVSVQLLVHAAARLRQDPTDMQADGDVAEASAGVFLVDRFGPLDEEEWSAVGRVTRRLLSLLGAEEALDADISREAAVLEKLLAPVRSGGSGSPGGAGSGSPGAAGSGAGSPGDGASAGSGAEGVAVSGADGAVVSGASGTSPSAAAYGRVDEPAKEERTVYDLAEWLPDQRAEIGVRLEAAGIAYEWEGDELLVPSSREEEVEAFFDAIGGHAGDEEGDEDDDSDEVRYQAVAELFAACRRLSSDPSDPGRRDAVLDWVVQTEGPPLFGMDAIDWFRIRSHAKALAAAIEEDHDANEVIEESNTLADLLRAVV